MRKLIRRLLILGGAVLIFVIFGFSRVIAQSDTQIGLSIVPAILETTVSPGQTTQQILNVRNITNQPLVIKVGVRSLTPRDELLPGYNAADYDSSKWLTPHFDDLSLLPNEQREVGFSITVPKTATPGGHYSQMVFRLVAEQPGSKDSVAQVLPEITSQIIINVPGEIKQSVDIDLSGPQLIARNNPITFSGHINNRGSSHVLALPFIYVKTSSGKLVDTINLPAQLVLPGTSRAINYNWQPNGHSGRLVAELEIRYDSPAKSLFTDSKTFLLLPQTNLLLSYVFMTLLGVAVVYKVYKKYWRRISPRRLIRPSGRTALQNERRDNSNRRLPTVVLDHLSTDSSLPEKPPTKPQSTTKPPRLRIQ